jgi:tetratricopeptide (TPR) repeat protein
LVLPLAFTYALIARFKPVWRIVMGYAALVILAGIVLSLSRGGWVATTIAMLGLGLALLFYRQYRLPVIVVTLMIVGLGLFIVRNDVATELRLRNFVNSQGKVDDSLRFSLWQPAVALWQEHPWMGAGPGHFDYRFRALRPQQVQLRPERVHNDYLNTLADWGIIGAALVATAWGLLAYGVMRSWRFIRGSVTDLGEKKNSNKLAFVLGAGLGLSAILVHSLTDFNMRIPANAILVVVFMALITSHWRFATEKHWFTLPRWAAGGLALCLVLTAFYLASEGLKRGRQSYWIRVAEKESSYSKAQVAAFKKAYEVENRNFYVTHAIGDGYRIQSSEGGPDYMQLAAEAMQWYEKGMSLNPWDGNNYLRYGMCLDWIGKPRASGRYFDRAEELDPNGNYTMTQIGLHYIQLRNFAAARPWFRRSQRLQYLGNPMAESYLRICDERLHEATTNRIAASLLMTGP